MNDILAQVHSATGLIKSLLEVPAVASSAEARSIISQLQAQLQNVRAELGGLDDENDALRDKLKQLASPPEVLVQDGKYYSRDGDGPFCTSCYDLQRTLIRLHEMPTDMRNLGNWRCPVCSNHYQ